MSVNSITSGIISNGLVRSGLVAMLDFISSANSKALGAVFERKDKSASEHFVKVLHDEGLEPLWETFVCSLLTKATTLPEQISIIPGKLIGAAWHWAITDRQSINKEKINNTDKKIGENFFSSFYKNFVKGPSDFVLKLCGIGNGKNNFLQYAATQLGLFGLGSYALSKVEDENLPGVNIDPDEPFYKGVFKGLGYTIVEQATYTLSQLTRFCINFKEEFSKRQDKGIDKNVIAKGLANVVNERFFPGHIFAGIGASLTTYYFGKSLPKTTAAAIGEFPAMFFNRVANSHRRRATARIAVKDKTTGKYSIEPNYKFSEKELNGNKTFYEKFLNSCDFVFQPFRDKCNQLISKIFKLNLKELEDSFVMKDDLLIKDAMSSTYHLKVEKSSMSVESVFL